MFNPHQQPQPPIQPQPPVSVQPQTSAQDFYSHIVQTAQKAKIYFICYMAAATLLVLWILVFRRLLSDDDPNVSVGDLVIDLISVLIGGLGLAFYLLSRKKYKMLAELIIRSPWADAQKRSLIDKYIGKYTKNMLGLRYL